MWKVILISVALTSVHSTYGEGKPNFQYSQSNLNVVFNIECVIWSISRERNVNQKKKKEKTKIKIKVEDKQRRRQEENK